MSTATLRLMQQGVDAARSATTLAAVSVALGWQPDYLADVAADRPISPGAPSDLHELVASLKGEVADLREELSALRDRVEATPAWIPGYYIDVFPVSNEDYARFVAATGHQAPDHWPDGQCPAETKDHPVVFVTWDDANTYAAWAGKTLPTGQQWEKAARGTRGTVYPWGDQPTPAKCNVRENGVGQTTARDNYQSGVSPYGVYDLCGNVWEWCSTESKPGRHELKGGAWTSPFNRATPSSFNDANASMKDDDTGFRCVVAADVMDELLRGR